MWQRMFATVGWTVIKLTDFIKPPEIVNVKNPVEIKPYPVLIAKDDKNAQNSLRLSHIR